MKILFACLLTLSLLPLWGQNSLEPHQKEGEWILMVNPETGPPALSLSIPIRTLSKRAGAYLVQFPQEQEENMRQQLGELPGFTALQPNYYLQSRRQEPDDPYFTSQWGLERIQAPEAWDFTTGGVTALGDTIVIAVMDNGFDLEHPDLVDNIWVNKAELLGDADWDDDGNGKIDDIQGWNFVSDTGSLPIMEHGTAVLGILGASGNNGTGVTGVNWKVKILPMVVKNIGDMIEAYDYAYQFRKKNNETAGAEGAFIVATSASVGYKETFCSELPGLDSLLDLLGQEGVLNVAATANGDWNVDVVGDIPTDCLSESVIAVTNADINDLKFEQAAYGALSIDLAAPGGAPDQGAFTTSPPGAYEESFGGTSAACPHVSGAVALLYSIPSMPFAQKIRENPAETALLVKEAILEGTDSLQAFQGITLSGGRLNLYRSVLYLHGHFQSFPIADPLQYSDRRRLIRVFPSPIEAGQPLNVVYGSKEINPVTVRLFNALGQLVQQYTHTPSPFSDQFFQLPTTNLDGGVYWLVLENGISPLSFKLLIF